MNLSSLHVSTLRTEVYKLLKQQIIQGERKPGQKVTIRQIAQDFGVSTMPVREAITTLKTEGFLFEEKRSFYVSRLSANEVRELFAIRNKLEELAIGWAFEQADEAVLHSLQERIDEMDRYALEPVKWRKQNRLFHQVWYEASRSEPLMKSLEYVWSRIEAYMNIYTNIESDVRSIHTSQKEHKQMLTLLQENKRDELLELNGKHAKKTAEAIIQAITEEDAANE
ncbi:GntR family transcriptional regulator [Marinococcus halophilus]|uniref:HTH gntR-type domain-containing protein n=1 Tax=Marinococcus halophilus TaxID=1371 RepID=A0A510Y2W2_MARHA|nr:GntR family transcriptional regulator [Marinococcus halophilus]GEK57639.1 hypothetical protein MHA01_05440 [Marinococcus halophilus]